jgi:hypothetical protein
MTPPETAAIKPEGKKVNVASKPDKAGRAQIRVAEEARAARARIDQAECLVAAFIFPPGGEDDPGPRLGRSSPL